MIYVDKKRQAIYDDFMSDRIQDLYLILGSLRGEYQEICRQVIAEKERKAYAEFIKKPRPQHTSRSYDKPNNM